MNDEQQEQHLADFLDRASAIEMESTERAIQHVQSQCKQRQTPRPDGSYEYEDCEDCGGEIGEARLKVAINNHLCIHCATVRERLYR